MSRRVRRTALAAQIEYLFTLHHRSYGSPRITADLRAAGWRVSPNTVAALMAEHGLVARRKRRRRSTTRRGRSPSKAPDALRRDFTAEAPDTKWCGDLTEIPTDEGRFYLAAVLDLLPRVQRQRLPWLRRRSSHRSRQRRSPATHHLDR